MTAIFTSSGFIDFKNQIVQFLEYSAFMNVTWGHLIMICLGVMIIALAILKEYLPLLLIPIGFGIIIGNIPFLPGFGAGIFEENSVLNILHHGVRFGWYPPLIFLAIGAMTDFSAIISNPKLMLIGAVAQIGIFGAYMLALVFNFSPTEAGSIGIIGVADGVMAIFVSSKLSPDLVGIVAVSAFLYMAIIPVLQKPVMRLFTTNKERLIHMKPLRQVSKTEKILFPLIGVLLTAFIVPACLPLLGMLFFGNLLKESGVTRNLANTVSGPMVDIVTILIGLTIGASLHATVFLTSKAMLILLIGAISFIVATAVGVLFVKFINLFLKEGNKINPLIGNAGVSAMLESARFSQVSGQKYDPNNHLFTHAIGPNVAGIIGSAVAAGILMSFLG